MAEKRIHNPDKSSSANVGRVSNFQGHMTKMATIPIYGKNPNYFCPVTVLVDSQVSDSCPWATCLYRHWFPLAIDASYKI